MEEGEREGWKEGGVYRSRGGVTRARNEGTKENEGKQGENLAT